MTDEPTDEPTPTDEIGYAAAIDELEELLGELEDDTIDIDLLGERVRRAAELIRICRGRIEQARVDVTEIVAGLSADAASVEDGDGS